MLLKEKRNIHELLVEQLLKKCEEVQNENSRMVMRINNVKKQIRKRSRDVGLLKRRLDKYNDNWRMLPVIVPHPKRKIEQKRGPKPKIKDPNEPPKEKKPRKQRAKKIVVATISQIVANPRTTPVVIPSAPKTSSVGIFNISRPHMSVHQLQPQHTQQPHAWSPPKQLTQKQNTFFSEYQLNKILQKNQNFTFKH